MAALAGHRASFAQGGLWLDDSFAKTAALSPAGWPWREPLSVAGFAGGLPRSIRNLFSMSEPAKWRSRLGRTIGLLA
jgi:hypothetical protein